MNALRARFDALSDRERRIVGIGLIAALVLLIVAIVMPLERSVSQAAARVTRKQADLGWLQQMAPALATAPQVAAGGAQESLIVLVDRTAREAGLGQALTGSQPSGNGALRTQFEKADFNRLVAWIALLAEQHGVQADSANFEAVKDGPGTVNAVVTLHGR
ncbi:MAG: type II secretion system protein M [Steroidobacteraceae bacterium]